MDSNQKIPHKRATSLALIPFCISRLCVASEEYTLNYVSKFGFIGGQIRTTPLILSSQLHLSFSLGPVEADGSQRRLAGLSWRRHAGVSPWKLWIIPSTCGSSTCRRPRASVPETTSFLPQRERQEAFRFRSEVLSRGHSSPSSPSFLVIVDT